MGHKVNYGAWWSYSFQRLGGLEPAARASTTCRRSDREPGEIVLTSFADRRDRTALRRRLQRSRLRRHRPAADRTTGPCASARSPTSVRTRSPPTSPTSRPRSRPPASTEGFMTSVAPGSASRDRQRVLQDRRGVHLRLRRRDARGVQGDHRRRAHPAARRSVDRRELGPGQPGAHRRGLPAVLDDPGRGDQPRDQGPADGPHPLPPVLGQLARPAHHRHPDERHRRRHAGDQRRRLLVRGRQRAPRARVERVAGRQAARRQAHPARASSATRRTWSSIPSWWPSGSCASPSWSGARTSSRRPIAGSAGASIPTSRGPSSSRWRRAPNSPASTYGAAHRRPDARAYFWTALGGTSRMVNSIGSRRCPQNSCAKETVNRLVSGDRNGSASTGQNA